MKTAVEFQPVLRIMGTGVLLFAGFTGILARAADAPLAASPAALLAAAQDPSHLRDERMSAWQDAGIKGELLVRFQRLLPDGFSADAKRQLAAALLKSPADERSLEKEIATFPKVDELTYDGQRYMGGNLHFIDAMLGHSGRPIAFDRELPALLVPLSPDSEVRLSEMRSAFQANPEAKNFRAIADQAYGEGAGALMLADGQFLRAYSGRFDDLYFHLFQNGNGASALAFCALADGLEGRVYQPLNGIRPRGTIPVARIDLDDILSGGAKAAVKRHLGTLADRSNEPFKGLAFRVLPSVVGRASTLPAGARFTASLAEISEALRNRKHLYPTQVPPLYRSADRFLGWAGSHFIPVANGPALPPGAADAWYPLPQREDRTPGGQSHDGASSAQLFTSSSASELAWEDPQLSNLLGDPGAEIKAPSNAGRQPQTAGSGGTKTGPDPRRQASVGHLIAVVTPTAAEATGYLAAIAASDEKLRSIEQTRGRLRLLRQFVESAQKIARPGASGRQNASSSPQLERVIAADLASFAHGEEDAASRLQAALRERADLRAELENRLTERAAPLRIRHSAGAEPRGESALSL